MPILLITALGAVLRFVGIGHQGFWYDEAYTVYLVKLSPGRMFAQIPQIESTPYLYYCVAWVWGHVFGQGPAGLKSLSAVCGTLTIPIAYATARKMLANWRAALIVAALTACNPFLIWYSQEARAYAMLVMFSACTLLAFAYARERPRALPLTLWAVACALALLTHYYALILILPEAAWLLYEHRHARAVQVGIGAVAVVGAALLPLAITQNRTGNNDWIGHASLWLRLGQILPMFVLGPETHLRDVLKFLGFAMVAVGIALLIWRSRRRERQAALLPGALALVGFVLSAGPGHSTLLARNLLPIWLPAALFLAAGLGTARARLLGIGAATVLCAIGITAVISVNATAAFQRPNWQPLARALGSWPAPGAAPNSARVVIVQNNPGGLPLGLYLRKLRYVRTETLSRVAEIDVVAVRPHGNLGGFCWWGSLCNLVTSRLDRDYNIPGFHIARRLRVGSFDALVLKSSLPRTIQRSQLPTARSGEHGPVGPTGKSNDAQLIERS